MSLIDLSAATPATKNAIAEEQFNEQLQTNALAQMLSIINQGRGQLPPLQREAVEMLQIEGMAVAIEFIAQQCGVGEHAWIQTLRGQIVADAARRTNAAMAEQPTADATAEQPQHDPAPEGYTNVAVGYSPEATAANAGAIRTALLMGFIQLSQQYPDTAIEPQAARVARQWIPTEDAEDSGCDIDMARLRERGGHDDEARAEAGERRDWQGSDDTEDRRPA